MPRGHSLSVVALTILLAAAAQAADWKPTRPNNLIVPWAAGGSTDQVTRVVAAELEKPRGQTIVIVNQPGASGSIWMSSALEAPRDGYTWAAGAAQDLGAYETLGSLKTRITDWHQSAGAQRQRQFALSDHHGAARRDEGETGQDLSCDRWPDVNRPYGHGADRQGGDDLVSIAISAMLVAIRPSSPPWRAKPTSQAS